MSKAGGLPDMSRRRDPHTLDLLDWQPSAVVKTYPEETLRAVNWSARIAKAVAATLKECGMPRALVASRMGEFLGETVSENMLDNYASEAREDTVINATRLIALLQVTRDTRLLQVLADPCDWAVVDQRYVSQIRAAQMRDKARELEVLAAMEERRGRGAGR